MDLPRKLDPSKISSHTASKYSGDSTWVIPYLTSADLAACPPVCHRSVPRHCLCQIYSASQLKMSQKHEIFQAQDRMQAFSAASGHLVPDERKEVKAVLPRSISMTNLETTDRCRSVIKNDWRRNAPLGGTNYFATTPGYTLILPALNDYPGDFQKFIFSRIVAKNTQESMEKEYCLNWCPNATQLVPLNTVGDGNCLLHAASLAMWGFQDRDFVLRIALAHAVNDEIRNNTLYQRWKHNREAENQQQFGLQLEPHQWDQEWQMVRQQTSATAQAGQNVESLDEFHVFILANILRRPVIMYAAPKLRSHQTDGTLQKINFHGVYLPLLWAPDSCKKTPLPLAYHNGHFSALVVVESAQQYQDGQLLLPLSDYFSQQLPVRFTLPVEDPTTLLMDYLYLVQVPAKGSPYFSNPSVICAKMTISDVPTYLKPLISGFINACYEVYTAERQQTKFSPTVEPPTAIVNGQHRPLCINDCGMYGDPATGLCSKCRQKAIGAAQAQEKAAFEEKLPQLPQGQFQNEQPRLPDPTGVSGAIKCPRCSNPGHPAYLGMCEQCFKSKSTKQVAPAMPNERERWSQTQGVSQPGKDPVYEVLPNFQSTSQESVPASVQHPPAVPPPRNAGGGPLERSQCRSPGCEFFGTKETRFYCSKCFESNMKSILEEVDKPPLPGLPADRRLSDAVKAPPTLLPAMPGSGPSREPPKCYKCREFFASDEYNGMCYGCCMKMTAERQGTAQQTQWAKAQTEPKYNLQTVTRCITQHCENPATENGYCEYCNAAGTRLITHQQSQTQMMPVPKPRSKITTQPVSSNIGNLSSSLAGISVSANESSKCFLCTGCNIGASNFVCEYHARMMQKMQSSVPKQHDVAKPTPEVRPVVPQKGALPYEEPSLLKPVEPFQPKVSSSVGGNVPFGVPLSGPILSASHGAVFTSSSAYPAGSTTSQDKHLSANSQLETAQSYGQNCYGAGFAGSAGASGGAAGGEAVAAVGGIPSPKTLCATPGCSFKGYKELENLCPDCYQEIRKTTPPPGFPLV